jgi:hypothetical protein
MKIGLYIFLGTLNLKNAEGNASLNDFRFKMTDQFFIPSILPSHTLQDTEYLKCGVNIFLRVLILFLYDWSKLVFSKRININMLRGHLIQ